MLAGGAENDEIYTISINTIASFPMLNYPPCESF